MLGIRQAYNTATKTLNFGVQGYHVQKKYFDPKNQSYDKKTYPKKFESKKGSYLDDYVAVHGKIPGPGVYDFSIKGSVYQKTKDKKHNYPDKKTIFDQMCQKQKRQKRPAPGQYQPDSKTRPSSAVTRRPKASDRITYLDQVQYESSVTPGVGSYNPRPQTAKVERRDRMKPEDWRTKHLKDQRASSGLKEPTPFTYNPNIVGKKSFSKPKKGFTTWGNIDRFKTVKANDAMGPGKYCGHNDWTKNISYGNQSNGLSVYYR